MKSLFSRDDSSKEPEVHLAAFGKHPGWDDHLPGIGLDTELLARLKQMLYVNGIGGQIDSGGWEKLESSKRLPGFEHSFLGIFGSQSVLGCFWSSSDRLGRAKYPMVLCLQISKFTPAGVYQVGWPILEALRNQCQKLKTADEVNAACAQSLVELRSVVQQAPERVRNLKTPLSDRQQFMESPNLGPQRSGFLRVFHELDLAGSSRPSPGSQAGDASRQRSRFSRIPVPKINSSVDAMVVWADFFRCAIPPEMPILLLHRRGVDWVETIIDEARGEEFFCLQASTLGLPLATEVPYDLPDGLKSKFELIQQKFLNQEAIPVQVAGDAPAKVRGKKSGSIFYVIGAVLLVLAVLGWFASRSSHLTPGVNVVQSNTGKTSAASAVVPADQAVSNSLPRGSQPVAAAASVAASKSTAPDQTAKSSSATAQASGSNSDQQFKNDLSAGNLALQQGKFDAAQAQAAAALELKPGDIAAMQLKTDAQARQSAAVAAAARAAKMEKDFANAITSSQTAFQAGDYEKALQQALFALGLKPGDGTATQLQADAQTKLAAGAAAAQDDAAYTNAITAGLSAFQSRNFNEASRQAKVALTKRPGDDTATQLDHDAQAKALAAQNDADYTNAIAAGQSAYQSGNYKEASRQAGAALTAKPGDDAATKLKTDADASLQAAMVAENNEQKFNAAIGASQAALNSGNFDSALSQAKISLNVKPGDSAAEQLLSAAQKGLDLSQARAAYNQGDFPTVNQLCAKYPGDPAFAALGQQVSSGGRGVLESEMEVLKVKFGLESATSAKSQAARASTEIGGQLSIPDRAYYINQVDTIRRKLKASGWLTPDIDKNLDEIKSAITSS